MFDFIRNHKRWMQFILLLLILPSFVFFGVEGYSSFMASEPEIATVDGEPITLGELNRARAAQLEQYRNMLGGQFDPTMLDTPQFREQVLNGLIDQRVVTAAAQHGRYSVSDETLRRTIASIPAVQQDGQFSSERYRQVLAAQGMTPAQFEAGLRRDLVLAQVLQPIGVSARVPTEVANRIFSLLTEQRSVSRQQFKMDAYTADQKVSEADVKAWYDANQARLRVPESVDVDYVLINEEAATKGVKFSDQDVEGYYKQNQSKYGQAERRKVSHILIEVPAQADEAARSKALEKAKDIAAKAAAQPDGFAELARTVSQDPGSAPQGGDLGWISKNMLVPQVEDAVFKLERGKVSGVVESPFGYHVLYITDIQPPSVKPLSEVRAEIEDDIRKQLAANRFADMAAKLTNLVYDQRDSLKPIADTLGLTVLRGEGITREGLLNAEQKTGLSRTPAHEEILNNPKFRQIAFSSEVLKDKLNSGVIEISPDTIVALRVAAIHPAHVPPLSQVSDRIHTMLIGERAHAAAVKAGEQRVSDLAKAGAAVTDGFAPIEVVSRQNPGKLSQAELEAVMNAEPKPLPKFIGVKSSEGYAILQLTQVQAGPAAQPGQVEQLQSQLSQAWGATEEQAALKILRQIYKVKILPDAQKIIAEGDKSGM